MSHLGNLNLKRDELDSNHLCDQEGDQQVDCCWRINFWDSTSLILTMTTNLLKYSLIIKNC